MTIVMTLNFQTDRSGQTEEQSDQRLHYLQYCLHLLDAILDSKISFSSFRMITAKNSSAENLGNLRYVKFLSIQTSWVPLTSLETL